MTRWTVKLGDTWSKYYSNLNITEFQSGLCAAAALAKVSLHPASQSDSLGYPNSPSPR